MYNPVGNKVFYLISALILRLTVQIGSCGTVVSVIVKQLILHEPVERMRL